MALTVIQHPNASAVEKGFAGWYLAIEGTAHVSLVVGSTILAWEALVPAAAVGEAACVDGNCTNEARAATQALELTGEQAQNIAESVQTASWSGTTVLGRVGQYWETAKAVGANALNVPDTIWNSWSRASQWLVNKSFIDLAIKRGDAIRLASPYQTQMDYTRQLLMDGKAIDELPFYSRELLYLQEQGYHLVTKLVNGQWIEFMEK